MTLYNHISPKTNNRLSPQFFEDSDLGIQRGPGGKVDHNHHGHSPNSNNNNTNLTSHATTTIAAMEQDPAAALSTQVATTSTAMSNNNNSSSNSNSRRKESPSSSSKQQHRSSRSPSGNGGGGGGGEQRERPGRDRRGESCGGGGGTADETGTPTSRRRETISSSTTSSRHQHGGTTTTTTSPRSQHRSSSSRTTREPREYGGGGGGGGSSGTPTSSTRSSHRSSREGSGSSSSTSRRDKMGSSSEHRRSSSRSRTTTSASYGANTSSSSGGIVDGQAAAAGGGGPLPPPHPPLTDRPPRDRVPSSLRSVGGGGGGGGGASSSMKSPIGGGGGGGSTTTTAPIRGGGGGSSSGGGGTNNFVVVDDVTTKEAAFAAAISPLGDASSVSASSAAATMASGSNANHSSSVPRDKTPPPRGGGNRGGGGGSSSSTGYNQERGQHVSSSSHKGQHGSSSGGGSSNRSRIIEDESVQLDHLPMADLMAYLQLVANNSSNLPLTRRDDPELGRTVSNLSPEEYAHKCAAFVPSMVRILGGQYGKYGSVWDLKTSEEFDVRTTTREPGISHGGSTCNALLKAMYDSESEFNKAVSPDAHHVDAKDLFDDDDDATVDTAGYTIDRTISSFETLVLNDGCNNSTMTWAQLLRKMKPEMQGVGFNQAPALTSSYRLDLNEPFSLVPHDFKKGVNTKRALLIGCNYRDTTENVQLKASHDDVRSIKDFLVNVYGFGESSDTMMVLMDDKNHIHPTHTNITNAFKTIAEKSQPGDAVFVLFTGHGCRVLDSPIDETAESYDEALIPSDFDDTGIIRDTLIFKTLLAPMKKGVMVTCIIDCCHTGVMIDLPYLYTTKGDKGELLPKMSLNDDFSFVRFLKVVKTLYESSVFTRIGKTVGNELNKQTPIKDDDTVIETVDSLETTQENDQPVTRKSFFESLCHPATLAQNLINCTLTGPDEFSDDEDDERMGMNSMTDEHSTYSYNS